MLPYEHKRGRCKRAEDNTPLAWPIDRVQVLAYAMMLEESLGRAVPEGRIHYHADNVTVRVPVDDAAPQSRAMGCRRGFHRDKNQNLAQRCRQSKGHRPVRKPAAGKLEAPGRELLAELFSHHRA